MQGARLVLVVDRESDMRDLICMNLKRAGLATVEADDARALLRVARETIPSLIVLDAMVSSGDDAKLLDDLQADDSLRGIPVIMLTGRGLNPEHFAGVEDFIAKPFSPRELVLRVQAALGRRESASGAVGFGVGPFKFDITAIEARLNGRLLPLTLIEFKLLRLLASRHGEVVQRESILREVWGQTDNQQTRSLDTHIGRLRRKLGDFADWLHTSRGSGYCFRRPASPPSVTNGPMHEAGADLENHSPRSSGEPARFSFTEGAPAPTLLDPRAG